MLIDNKNFAFVLSPPPAKVYAVCNFTQAQPGTRIFPADDTPRHFVQCNLTNCIWPAGSTLDRCNTTQSDACVEDGEQEIKVGTKKIKIKKYVQRVYGRLDPDTGELIPRARDHDTAPPVGTKDRTLWQAAKDRDKAAEHMVQKEKELEEANS